MPYAVCAAGENCWTSDSQHAFDILQLVTRHFKLDSPDHGMQGKCIRPDGTRQLIADVGSNFGWYSLYAAALGCR